MPDSKPRPSSAVYRGLRYFRRNTRRAFTLLGWLVTGQFTRAANALIPYYRRYVPAPLKKTIPRRLRERLIRRLQKRPSHTRLRPAEQGEKRPRTMHIQRDPGEVNIVRIPGTRPKDPNLPTVLVCAHQSTSKPFGAEYSFLDILDGFAAIQYNVVVVVPNTENAAYVDALIRRATGVVSFQYGWWRAGTPLDDAVVKVFQRLIDLHGIDAVHVNTIVVREPLVAARRKKIPAVVHAREIITDDPWLCREMGADAGTIVREVVANADHIVANSQATARCYSRSKSVIVVPNTVDIDRMDVVNEVDPAEIRFGLLSSNLPKKGLGDVVELARLCESSVPNARFITIGPDNQYVKGLKNDQRDGKLPGNVEFLGYRDTPRDAMAEANVILCLSHFKESFGRTVIEGMAARRPVIAYDWGAPPELIRDGETGFVVGFRNMDQLLDRVRLLCEKPDLIAEMGHRGRVFVEQHYSQERFAERLRDAYRSILSEWQPPRRICDLDLLRKARPTAIVIPVYDAYEELRECFASVAAHTNLEKNRVIVIDDCSTDARVREFLATVNNIELVCNEQNTGFTRTCNKGIAMAAPCDVVLLNSDTIVTPRWLESLRAAAYSAADIGTATALSDNAGAFSVPVPDQQNTKPGGIDYSDYARLMRQFCGGCEIPDVPTGNGFCLFIKRELINEIGAFDAGAFPRGYGEENDFCMRAVQVGWRNVIAPAAFVFHRRQASFGARKERLLAAGMKTIRDRYPDYPARAKQAFSSPPIERVRSAAYRAAAAAATPLFETRIAVVTRTDDMSQTAGDAANRRSFVTVEENRMILPQADALPDSHRVPATVTRDFEQEFCTWLLIQGIDRVEVEAPDKLPFDVKEACCLLGIPLMFE